MHTKIYAGEALGGYDDPLNAKYDKSRMDLVPKDEMLPYAGGDADAVLRVSDEMLIELKQWPTLPRFYTKLLHPAARTFEKIETVGLLVDQARYATLKTDLELEITRLEKAGLALMPRRLCLKYADNLTLSRAALLKDYFFSPMGLNLKPLIKTGKTGEPSTAKSHLEMFGDVPESKAFCAILEELNSAKKVLSTYVIGFLAHLQADGRFHPGYLLHSGQAFEGESEEGGAVTGRLSARGPAIQTVPKRSKWAKRIRECFICPPGKVMISADFIQGELKIAACIANEETMIKAYLAGIDLHAKTGAGLIHMELDDFLALKFNNPDHFDSVRGRAKPANFGLLFSMRAQGYQNYAWSGYRVRMSLEEAEKDLSAFFNTYPGLLDWHRSAKNTARQQGYIMSPLGRVRHLPLIHSPDRSAAAKAERQAINSPVQATLSDLMLWSLAEIDRNYPQYEACAMIHDAGIFYAPEDQADAACQRITNIMADLPIEETFGWKPQLRFTAEAEAGPDMAHLKKVAVH
jgi:DNA polymerase I-like protein with 3'-5' exonuclease and polymerase domains